VLDLPQDVLEEVALAVRVDVVEAQLVDQVSTWLRNRRLIDTEPSAIPEVQRRALGHLGVEREDLIADEPDQLLACLSCALGTVWTPSSGAFNGFLSFQSPPKMLSKACPAASAWSRPTSGSPRC